MKKIQLLSRYYDMVPIGQQKGYSEEILSLPLGECAFFLVDVYGTGYSDGEPRPQREPLWFAGSFEREREMIVERIVPSVNAARSAGMPLVYANNSNPLVAGDRSQFGAVLRRTHGLTDGERWRTERPEEFEYSACIRPQPGDYEVKKLFYSGFHGTFLDTLLRNLGVNTLISVGFATNACLHTTLTDAMYRNFRVVLIRDCTLGMECDDTYRDLSLTRAFIRFIETHVGYTSTSSAFLESVAHIPK